MTLDYAWQQDDWRDFTWDVTAYTHFERQFLHDSGIVVGLRKALSADDSEAVKITFLSDEGLNTAEIEGEYLDRDSLQSSVQRYFQFKTPLSKNRPRENGMAQMMVDLYLQFDAALTHEMLFAWHQMLLNGRTDVEAVGAYRLHTEPMRIVSSQVDGVRIHYEAPPSEQVHEEMALFIAWFNASRDTLPPLVRAGMAHAYFELIHPFEDGNGRIGRALIEKALAQSAGQPTLIAVSQTIQVDRKAYYQALSSVNRSNDFSIWLNYFCQMVLTAQQFTIDSISFLIAKVRFFDQYASQLNARQLKMVQRIFQEGLKGFTGGVSVKNYIAVTDTSPATANRDLNDLVAKGIMKRSGKLKSTRYWLQMEI
jgi:Fic family protein